jgi:hypothetical protein
VNSFTERPCIADDIFTFNSNGTLNFESNNTIWRDEEQFGGWNDGLGGPICHNESEPGLFVAYDLTDVSAFANGGAYNFTYEEITGALTITGDGHYIGITALPVNGGESYWTFNLVEADLLASYPFNANANDVTGNGNDLSIFGTFHTNDRFSQGSRAYGFNGVDDYLSTPTDVIPPSGDFSVSMWAKYLGPTNTLMEIVSQNNDSGNNFYFGQNGTGTIRVGDGWETPIPFPSDGNWHHYVVTKTDFNTILYIDNAQVVQLGSPIANPISVTPEFRVGRQYGTNNEYFNGSIDDIRVYSSAFSTADINALYTEGGWPTAPAAPSGFSAYPTSANNVDLAWNDTENETGYTIEYSTDDITYSFYASPLANSTNFAVSGLAENTLYYFRIKASNAQGESPYTNRTTATFSTTLTTTFNFNSFYGGPDIDRVEGIVADDVGNFYVTGSYQGEINFGGNTLFSTNPNNSQSGYLVKFDPNGNVLWARDFHPDWNVNPRDIAIANDNSIYVTGRFRNNMTFAGNTITSSADVQSLFLLKYDQEGTELWAQTIISPDGAVTAGQSVDVDDLGNVYVGGWGRNGGATFAGSTVTTSGIYVFKYDQNGTELLMAHGSSSSNSTILMSIEVDASGVYVTGRQHGSMDVGNGVSSTTDEAGDVYLVKFDSNGNAQWLQNSGGSDYDTPWDLALDDNSNIYVVGWFYSPTFDAPGISLTNNGNSDIIILKYDTNGTLLWGQNHGNLASEHAISVTTDGVNAYVTGDKDYYPVSFGGLSIDNGNFFLSKYLPDGTVEWVEKMEGVSQGYELDYKNGVVYMGGDFWYSTNFGSYQTLSNNLTRDIHIGTIDVGLPGALIAHWPVTSFDGANDVSGNNNHLDPESTNLILGTNRFNTLSETFVFDGTNYTVARASNHPTGDVTATYSFWEKHTGSQTASLISAGDLLTGNARSAVQLEGANIWYNGNGNDYQFSAPVQENRWNHIVVVKEGTSVTLYLNGEFMEEGSIAPGQNVTNTDIFIGVDQNLGLAFAGRMDDIRIYNYALTSTEVLGLFNEGVDTSIPIVRIEPAFPTPDEQVRLIYNAERGNKALMGLENSDVYLFSGAITSVDDYIQPWDYVAPSGWPDNSVGLMTPVSGESNQWEITLSPSIRDFHSVPIGTPVYKMAMVFRNSDGSLGGTGTPDHGPFDGGLVTDGTNFTTAGDIYINLNNPAPCGSFANFSDDSRINRVVFNDLDNTSPGGVCESYSDYRYLFATVYPGQDITVGAELGTCGGDFDKMIKVYIDYNQDYSFDESEVIIFSQTPSFGTEYISTTTTFPSDVAVGTYTMRVVLVETDILSEITGCGTYDYGETEDYSINVVSQEADLSVTYNGIEPSSIFNEASPIGPGQSLSVDFNVVNLGLADSPPIIDGILYYISSDLSIDGSDWVYPADDLPSIFGLDQLGGFNKVFQLPENIPFGSYNFIIVVDPNNELNEANESNNIIAYAQPFFVGASDSPPTVSLLNPPTSYEIGTGGITVSANIFDDTGLQTVVLAWARISEITDNSDLAQYNTIIPEEISQDVYEHRFADEDFDDIGIQYFFGATDISGNIGNSSPATIFVQFPEGTIGLSGVSPVSNSENPSETDYRIFSVPVRSTTLGQVLGNPETDKTKWRVWRYSGTNSELSISSSLSAGNGYWLIYQNTAGLALNVGGLAVQATNSSPFIMNLTSGINLIGNPYHFTISWQEVLDHNISRGIINPGDISGLTFYRGGFASEGNSDLLSTEGAFVQSNEAFSLEIPVSSSPFFRTANNARTSRNGLAEDNWEVGIDLTNDATFYNVAALGMNPEAEEGKDKFDQMAMPFLFRYLEFNSENEQFNNERFSKDVVKTAENHIWEFEAITSFDPSEASLSWDNSYFGDNDQQLYLYDLKEERIINMREQMEYHFFLREKQNFKILYGTPEFIESNLKPGNFTLGHAYPNPFANITRIPFSLSDEYDLYKVRLIVYNSIGELVKVLAEDDYQSGFYTSDWDGSNEFGQKVSEGIYIYKLRITHENGSDELTGKLIYGN